MQKKADTKQCSFGRLKRDRSSPHPRVSPCGSKGKGGGATEGKGGGKREQRVSGEDQARIRAHRRGPMSNLL
jgi:hypothetical protein